MSHIATGLAVLVALLIGLHTPAGAVILFSDNFDAEPNPGGLAGLNYNAFTKWDVSDGTVDFIAQGDFGLSCAGGSGKCVDMDGTSGDAGRIDTKTTFNLAPGTYQLSFDFSGNQRGGDPDTLFFGVTNALFAVEPLVPPDQPFITLSGQFTVLLPTSGTIFFDHAGGDDVGIILDNVVFESLTAAVPAPAAGFLLGTGLLVTILRRKFRA